MKNNSEWNQHNLGFYNNSLAFNVPIPSRIPQGINELHHFPIENGNHQKINNYASLGNQNSATTYRDKCSNQSSFYGSKSDNYSKTPKSAIESSSDLVRNHKRKFTPEEDRKLINLIARQGAKKWDRIALSMPGRTGRQCRDRFHNYLDPSLSNGPWTKEEDNLLEEKVNELGQHWNKIVNFFHGRSENNIKNRWYTYVSKQRHDLKMDFQNLKCINNVSNCKHYEGNKYAGDCFIQNINDCINNNNLISINPVANSKNSTIKSILLFNEDDNSKKVPSFGLNINNNLKNENYEILPEKAKKDKKMFFPPLFPTNDTIDWPLDQGIFNFLNNLSVV